jgi:hypothetical protein
MPPLAKNKIKMKSELTPTNPKVSWGYVYGAVVGAGVGCGAFTLAGSSFFGKSLSH